MTPTPVALAVDDDPETRAVLVGILELLGLTVLTAADGEEALRVLQTQAVQLVVSDVAMPRLRGDELCQRVKTNPATR